MFHSADHALAVAYWLLAVRIEPKSPTHAVLDMLRERYDATYIEKLPTGLTQHDWHCQAVMTVKFTQRQLAAHPLELAVIRAEYASGDHFVVGLGAIRDWLAPEAGIPRKAAYALLLRMFKRNAASIRDISELTGVPKSTLHDWDRNWREQVHLKLGCALTRLHPAMVEVGLVHAAEEVA